MKQSLIIFFLFCFHAATAKTITVGNASVFKTIRNAIEAAQPGDTVLVQKGIYKEGNIILTKAITLLGEKGAVLDGEDKNEILTISGEGIVVKGLHFQNSGYSSMNDFASIKIVDASYVLIENNIINKAYFAIHIANATDMQSASRPVAMITRCTITFLAQTVLMWPLMVP